jgi:hypothetical protein
LRPFLNPQVTNHHWCCYLVSWICDGYKFSCATKKFRGAKIIILSLTISSAKAHVVMPTCYEPWKIWNNRYALKVLKFLVLLFAWIRQWRLLIVSIIQIQFCMNSKAKPWLLGCYLYFIRWKRMRRVIRWRKLGTFSGYNLL